MKRWICKVCGYIHMGEEPPEKCPQCGAPKTEFQLMEDQGLKDGKLVAQATKRELLPATTPNNEGKGHGTADTAADVIVVGSGAAAFAAAITAKNEGCSVIMLEKAGEIGGTTKRSGGGFWTPNNRFQKAWGIKEDREQTLRYMARYSYPHLYQPEGERYGVPENEFQLMEAMVDHAAEMTEYLENLGVFELTEQINWTGQMHLDYQDHLPENKSLRGRLLFTKDDQGEVGYGFNLINRFKAWAEDHNIPMLVNHEVVRIRKDDRGRVIGVEAKSGDQTISYTAYQGVIFGSGGFSHNPELMLHFGKGPIFGGCSAPSNTGDFITLAGEIGAKLGNMGGAFRAQSVFESVLENPGGSNNLFFIPGDSVLEVNRYGHRVMNEKRNYSDRGMVHFVWDPNRAEWTNMLLFMIFDARTADLWQGMPPYPAEGQEASYMIKGDSLEELGNAIGERLSKLKDHTGGFMLDEHFNENFAVTVERFNGFARAGRDEDFQRGEFAYDREWTTFPPTKPDAGKWPEDMTKNYTLAPLREEGPYYCVILASSTLDTNGGPMINRNSQVLDVRSQVIEGLYGAGNCIASPTANAYWGGGSTIGPAMTFGYIAAQHIAGNTDK
ncbi:FAD-dependent oxidoreductase [Dehalobacterium formicoaceticum]|uniref:FAD-dependent oxidoreductase n=1 Tax=Dehalobacterium formicoaceticum TaxID=51515 RepID=A0ABT1Y342_9FIRM|nr:FAD-dependent oxidoreductase [Dehalobacterium formicoaceticum]MCR6544359.1 FAD-dependent oxidoreductase [Dehalobacterium formicoaceticum]